MKTRIGRLCAFTVISLLSLLAIAAQAGAQDSISAYLNSPTKLPVKTAKADKAKIAGGYTESVLYSFCALPNCADGDGPEVSFQDAAGNLYGTTDKGGANGKGTVFKVDSTGHETVLYSFCSAANCTDGAYPSGVIQDAAGNLYGATGWGGANTGADGGAGAGTVFMVDSSGHETVLYSFCSASNCTDGELPNSGLIQDTAGNLYGTTFGGGNDVLYGPYGPGNGTVFKLAPPVGQGDAWTETVRRCSTSSALQRTARMAKHPTLV
jgi:uncharacterized repeat protein (TIGR03803 family)